jgi:hypothetical protein
MNHLESRQIDALRRVKEKPELQPFFFKKVKGVKWFDEMQKMTFFDPLANPEPKKAEEEGFYIIPFWPVLEYLEKTAPELQISENEEYAKKYLQIIRSTTELSMKSGVGNRNTWWYFAKIIKYIPIKLIKVDDIALCTHWLTDRFEAGLTGDELGNHFLSKLLSENTEHSFELALKLFEGLTRITWVEPRLALKNEQEPAFFIDNWHANKIYRNQSKRIGEVLGLKGLDIFKARISEIVNRYEKDEYSYIWRPAIEDHDQNKNRNDVLNILVTGFREALSGYVEENVAKKAQEVLEYISELLKSEIKLYKRIAIHVTGTYFEVLQRLGNIIIDGKFFTSHYRHELFYLLKNNFSRFEEEDKNKILAIIDSLTVDNDENEDTKRKQAAYKKLIWLKAVQNQGHDVADKLYSKYFNIIGRDPDHPDFSSYMESGWVGEISPYDAEQLLSQGLEKLIDILNSFKETGGWKTPTKRGLAEAFRKAIKTDPDYFKSSLSKFLEVDLAYICEIIQAYKELWTEKKYDNWKELLEFCSSVINKKKFWNEENNRETGTFTANRSWVVGEIGELLRSGTATDENAFDPSLLTEAKSILLNLLERQQGREFEPGDDAVSVSINSPRGKCIEALIDFSLRCCRLSDKQKDNHDEAWKELEPIFNKELTKSDKNDFEFITLCANYLPNLLYLNREWTTRNLANIFSKSDRLRWLCAMQGYAYVNAVYPEVYQFLRNEGHFIDALNDSSLKENVKEKVIQNIVVAYFNGQELLEDNASLINVLIRRWDFEEMDKVIWFVKTFGDDDKTVAGKIQRLWEKISQKIDDPEKNKKLLSNLCAWSVFISELNQNTIMLIKQTAPFAEVNYNSYMLIEALKKHVNTYPLEVAEIFESMLDKFAPTYPEEDVSYILSSLYNQGDLGVKRKTDEIVDKYIGHGVDFPAKIRDSLTHRMKTDEGA